MKESKLKIILPIILIPIVLIVGVVGYMSYKINQYKNDEFKASVTEKDITKYLKSKNEGEFKDIKLIETDKKKHSEGGGGCPVATADYYDEFFDYYTVYSEKYDTEFFVTAEKDIFSVTLYGCHEPSTKITDNLEETKIKKRYIDIICQQLSDYEYEITNGYYLRWYNEISDITKVIINDDFNMKYYDTLIQLKAKLIEEHKNLNDKNNKVSISGIYIVFNDKTFVYSGGEAIVMIRDGEAGIEIEDTDFLKYVNE